MGNGAGTLGSGQRPGDEWHLTGGPPPRSSATGWQLNPHWRVAIRFRQDPPRPIHERLDAAKRIEAELWRGASGAAPARVLVFTDGLAVAVHVQAREQQEAVQVAVDLLDRVFVAADIADLGEATAQVGPGWQPSQR